MNHDFKKDVCLGLHSPVLQNLTFDYIAIMIVHVSSGRAKFIYKNSSLFESGVTVTPILTYKITTILTFWVIHM